jgi:hypothetical protein
MSMPIEWWHETYSNMVDEARRSTNQDQRMKLSLTLPRQWLTIKVNSSLDDVLCRW